MSAERSPRDPTQRGESAGEALARARDHARNAASEAISALRALLDAAALGVSAEPADHHRALATLARVLDDLSERLSSNNTDVSSLILEALEAEIARWEARSQDDPDSRAVLRAFLGMREILWEFGLRSAGPATGATGATGSAGGNTTGSDEATSPTPRRRKPPRVQRVEVQG